MSCTELAQELVDKIHEKEYFSEEIMNNAMQVLKKIQEAEKELKNVPDAEEEEEEVEESSDDSTEGEDTEEEEDLEDFEKMTADEMKKKLGGKGIIISISGPVKE